jgi:Arc/MetJ-type ribon-helix-helix transcriptional regulator
MTIELKPEHQQTIDLAIRSGVYHDSGEVLDQAFEIIRAQLHSEDWLAEQREAVATQIATGFAQAERGELMDGDGALEMLHQRRAARAQSAIFRKLQLDQLDHDQRRKLEWIHGRGGGSRSLSEIDLAACRINNLATRLCL